MCERELGYIHAADKNGVNQTCFCSYSVNRHIDYDTLNSLSNVVLNLMSVSFVAMEPLSQHSEEILQDHIYCMLLHVFFMTP